MATTAHARPPPAAFCSVSQSQLLIFRVQGLGFKGFQTVYAQGLLCAASGAGATAALLSPEAETAHHLGKHVSQLLRATASAVHHLPTPSANWMAYTAAHMQRSAKDTLSRSTDLINQVDGELPIW